ncbi:hypothetical protein ElyMa_001764800 [Elysia marginata]|uniref:Uncharacterized protein n=1 Tax=Elysia marginata TaxID=1093978 RepID=A0AAV4ED50_9GAST|nr:hypothetical protein ElyMa_001764800 [Elysia marginata]
MDQKLTRLLGSPWINLRFLGALVVPDMIQQPPSCTGRVYRTPQTVLLQHEQPLTLSYHCAWTDLQHLTVKYTILPRNYTRACHLPGHCIAQTHSLLSHNKSVVLLSVSI